MPPSGESTEVLPANPPPITKGRAFTASLWSLGGDGFANVLRLLSSLVLARLLSPEITGLMALLMVCIVGIHMFSDLGIRAVIVQHRQGEDPDFYNSAWTIQVVRGSFLWICSVLIARPAAWFYGQPSLVYLLPLLGLTAIIDGFTSTKLWTCERHLNQKRMTLLNMTTQVGSIVVMVAWAYFSPSIWALVVGNLSSVLARTLLSHIALPGPRNRFRWQAEARREVLNFGRWVTLSSLFAFLALQADRLMFGKMIPMVLLGVYNTGAAYARLPVDTLLRLASSVGYPLFCRSYREGQDLSSVFKRVSMVIWILGGAGLSALILGGPAAIRVLYDKRWHDAGWIIQIVCVGSWFQILESLSQMAMSAMGQPKWSAIGNISKVVAMALALPLAFKFFGFPGALITIAITEVPRYLIARWQTLKCGLGHWGLDVGLTAALLGCCGLAYLIGREQSRLPSPWIGLAIAAAAYGLVWIPLGLWSWKQWKVIR